MFKNLFNLKMYKISYINNDLIEVKTIDDFRKNYLGISVKIMPSFQFEKEEYVVGDLFFDEEKKELLIFSFYSNLEENCLNTFGFFKIEHINDLIKTPNIYNVQYLKNEEIYFEFIKLNKIKNKNHLKKIGNIVLNKSFVLNKLLELNEKSLNDEISDSFDSLVQLIDEMSDIRLLVKDKKEYFMHFLNSIPKHYIFKENFKFYPKLWINNTKSKKINLFSYHGQINLSTITLNPNPNKHNGINKELITYLDLNTFEPVIKSSNDEEEINYVYLSKYLDKNYRKLRENDKDNEYLNLLALFL